VATYYPKCRVDLELWGASAPREQLVPNLRFDRLVPVSATVEKNPHDTADTFDLSLPRDAFPVDPRALRDIRVRVWMGDAGSLDAELPQSDPLIVGFVDEPPLDLSESGESVSLKGRDFTQLAIDTPWGRGDGGRKFRVRADRPLPLVVADVLRNYPETRALATQVVVRGGGTANVLTAPWPGTATARGRWFRWKADQPVWSALAELCARVGWTIWIDGEQVVLSAAEAVYGGSLLATPRFVWGESLTSLTITRRLTRERVTGVEVRCYNDREGRVYTARYPARRELIRGGQREYTQYRPRMGPHWTQARADEVARQAYELLRRQQMTGSFSTMELREGAHDLTRLNAGDTVRIAVDAATEGLIVQGLRGNGPRDAEALDLLVSSGLDPDVAGVLINNWRELLVPWQISRATHSWSQDEGYRLSGDVVNALAVEG
jgi:hypothetical protein